MTSSTPSPTPSGEYPQTAPPEQQPAHKKTLLGLTAPQVAGGALASVTAALAASRLGVGGTVIGAAFGSLVSTIGGALYTHSLDRAGQRVVITQQRLLRTRVDAQGAIGTEITTQVRGRRTATLKRPGWKVLAGLAAGLFVVAMGVITVLEFAIGHPVSDSSSSGTTVQRAVVGGPADDPTPTPAGDQASTPASPSAVPSPSVSPEATASPDAGPSDAPSAPEPTPSDAASPAASVPASTDQAPAPAAS